MARIKKDLKPFDLRVMQVCPICHKIDAYKNDGHNCDAEIRRQLNAEFYD
jgi:hypothetical protein